MSWAFSYANEQQQAAKIQLSKLKARLLIKMLE